VVVAYPSVRHRPCTHAHVKSADDSRVGYPTI
jgi:hypothetical protein